MSNEPVFYTHPMSHIGRGINAMHTLPARPAFVDCYERMSTRAAHVRANALDDALAAEIGPPA